ncbi:MAG: hypothetical protein ACE5H3_07050 [Planctomycetota bacterium]
MRRIALLVLLVVGASAWLLLWGPGKGTGSTMPDGGRSSPGIVSDALRGVDLPGSSEGEVRAAAAGMGEDGRREANVGLSSPGSGEESAAWWHDPEKLAAVSKLYPQFLPQVRAYYDKARSRPYPDSMDDALRAALEKEDDASGEIQKLLRYEDFADLRGDLSTYVQLFLSRQYRAAVEDRNLRKKDPDQAPLDYIPEYHLERFAKTDAWKGDPSLQQEIANLETRVMHETAKILGDQEIYRSAIDGARNELKLPNFYPDSPAGLEGVWRDYGKVSPEWARLEEAKKRLFDEYLAGIRNALRSRGLLKEQD